MRTLTTCNGTYTRDAQGVWRYPWGHPVPGAVDLTLSDLMTIDATVGCTEGIEALRPLTAAERRWLSGQSSAPDQILVRERPGHRPHAGDLIIAMSAPELHAMTMLTVADIAEAAGVSKSTIDSYRYRGYLPEPQLTRGRTPLWARPIVRRWLNDRPGSGWRSDIYLDAPAATATAGGGDPIVLPETVPAA
jgi:predicted DNA-binding transcriptional regulator AlpA